jgi:UDP-2,4-diacetamido-2,4,6-trideoxy-beta-L-altropyranose hydrolase
MKIVFRTDASSQIGTGHFMRCLTLADQLKKQGAHIHFICRDLPAHLSEMLKTRDMEYIPLSTDDIMDPIDELPHSSWLGTSQTQDAQATDKALASQLWDWIIVDHYALDERWERAVRANCKKLMVIDDLADRQHDCDVLLDQNFYADMQTRYNGKVPVQCQLLLGPRYALLREEFRTLREKVKVRTGDVKKILVFFGGVDADNYTTLAINALAELKIRLQVDVVIGAQHPNREQIQLVCMAHGYTCHVQTSRMAELMAEADLAIGGGGTATWERCCLGLPAVSICVAENQRKQIADAAEIALLYAPISERNLVEVIRGHVDSLLENPSLIKLISGAAMKIVDGNGVFSIVKELHIQMLNHANLNAVEVRRANASEAIIVWPWRNHETTRKYFFDDSELSIDEHLQWWNKSLTDSSRILLLGNSNGIDFGIVRFDFIDAEKLISSIYLNPSMTGKGLGRKLLIKGLAWVRGNYPEIKSVIAEIIPENIPSIRLFESVGFYKTHSTFRLELPLEGK